MVHQEHKRSWKNGKHQAQWISSLEAYAFPQIGDLSVEAIESRMVRDLLSEIWLEKPETARRVRQRVGAVLDYAFSRGWRSQEAPIRSVTKGLPRQTTKTKSFRAMPFTDIAPFISKLRERVTMGRLALEALILTAARSGEIRGARWDELDLANSLWRIPAERMKAGKPHAVPLSSAALEVFGRTAALTNKEGGLVFFSRISTRPLSDMTLLKVLRDMKLDYSVHGFRSSFRDWAAEETGYPSEVAEAALAHAIPNKVEAAYRRTDFLAKRRDLMEQWGSHCQPDTPATRDDIAS
jgi:integrase